MSGEFWIVLGFFAGVMALITAAGYVWLSRTGAAAGAAAGSGGVTTGGILTQWLELVGQVVPSSERDGAAIRQRLLAAGYRAPEGVTVFLGLKCGVAVALAVALGWVIVVVRESLGMALVPCMGALYVGYTLPDRVLRSLTRSRAWRLRQGLADALDLMVLGVEAGQSLDQALVDTGAELKRTYPDLGTELLLVHLELRAGKSRTEAFRNLADRNPEPELRKLSGLLIQADRFGTSLGPALRVHAKYLRIRSKQQAEEAARKISVKLLFPIFFLIFPCMMLVTAGPAILQIFTQLIPMIVGE